MTVGRCGFSAIFSVIMIVGLMGADVLGDGTGSILGGGTPVSRPKGVSSRFAPVALAFIGGPASCGVRNRFSPGPGRGPVMGGVTVGGVGATWVWGDFFFFSLWGPAPLTGVRFI